MKRIQIYTIIALAILLTTVAVFWRHAHNTENAMVSTATSEIQTPANLGKDYVSNQDSEFAHATDDPFQKLNEITGVTPDMPPEQIRQKVRDWYAAESAKMVARDQHPILFYGQTLNESNQPVSGVGIHFMLSNPPNPGANGILERDAQSDANGNFAISDVIGKTLEVWLSKNGYYVSKSNQISFDYTSYQPNPLRPELFHLRKKGTGADLISAVLNVKMPRDGTPVNIDLIKGKVGASGQLQISQAKPPYESWKTATAWSFSMHIPDGGFIEQSEEFPFEAPSSGYLSTIAFDFKAGNPDWMTNVKKSYYIVFGTPPCYGRIDIENNIMWGGAHISYSINPDGSRNLEPK